jgi:hypothetical protein
MKRLCEHCEHSRWIANAKWNPYFNTITTDYTIYCGAPGAPEGKIEQPVTECSDYKPTESAQ